MLVTNVITHSSLAIADLQCNVKARHTVLYFFGDFSAREHHTTLVIFQILLRQIVEQGDSAVVSKVKDVCTDDPSRLRELDGICAIVKDICTSTAMHLILDAPDELKNPDELLVRLQPMVTAGLKLLIISRDIVEVNRRFSTASKLDVKSEVEDIRRYVRDRIENSEFADELANSPELFEKIVSRAGTRLVKLTIYFQVSG
jgi:hypothetical protein